MTTSRREFWEAHFSSCKDSGLSQAEYCRQNNLNSGSFSAMKSKIKKRDLRPAQVSPSFIQLNTHSSFAVTINGQEFVFDRMPEPAWIAAFAIALGN